MGQSFLNRAAAPFGRHWVAMPREGWIATVRKALGMSGAQLARRLGVTRARISQAERAEVVGGVTLNTMRATAEAMRCRFVYAIVPDKRIEDIIAAQAHVKARAVVAKMVAEVERLDPSFFAQVGEEALDDAAIPENALSTPGVGDAAALEAFDKSLKGRRARLVDWGARAPKVVDTTAAGDSFNAGFLAAHLSGAPIDAAMRAGHDLAAKVVSHRGAIIPRDAM